MKLNEIIKDRYRLEEIIEHSGLETICKALDMQTQQPVLLKALHLSQLRRWKAAELLEREATLLKELSHPQIPAYIDFFTIEQGQDVHYVQVRNYIEGKTLQQRVSEGWRGTELELADIIRQLVDILEYLHALHPPVIHRDITPQNIILSSEKTLFLVDFGSVQERMRTTFLSSSTIAGTFGYMPFEQFSGQAVPASDYYAVGATLLYLLTHRHPSEFRTEGLKLIYQPYIQASTEMIHLLNGLLEPIQEQRLASANEVRNLLRKIPQTPEVKVQGFTQPYGSAIQKVEESDERLFFLIPGKFKDSGAGFCSIWFLFVAIWTFGASTTGELFPLLWSIPFWGAGFGFGVPAYYKAFGRTRLELTPEWVYVRYMLFGLQYALRFPTATLKRAATDQKPASVTFQSGAKPLKFGSHLTTAEKEWLGQEIEHYLALYAKPDVVISARPYGSKITKQVYPQNHLRFRLPLKFQKEPFIGLGFMIFWFGFLIFMLSETEEFVWFSLIFWVFGVLTTLGSLAGIIRVLSRTTLDLTPDWVQTRSAFLGIGFPHRVPLTTNTNVEVISLPQRARNEEPIRSIVIHSDAKELKLGWQLTLNEQEWLVQEIENYFRKPTLSSTAYSPP